MKKHTLAIPIILTLLLVAGFRWLGSAMPEAQPNFQPLAALFFCGTMLAANWKGFAIPGAIWMVTYPIPAMISGNTNWLSPGTALVTLAALAVMFGIGHLLRGKNPATTLTGAAAAAVVFHLITNTAAWIGNPIYPMNGMGLWQSLWDGPAGSPIPSWVFLKNLMLANVLFTGMVLLARSRTPGWAPTAQPTLA